jgi:hypothetical protein
MLRKEKHMQHMYNSRGGVNKPKRNDMRLI